MRMGVVPMHMSVLGIEPSYTGRTANALTAELSLPPLLWFSETGSQYGVQAGLELTT